MLISREAITLVFYPIVNWISLYSSNLDFTLLSDLFVGLIKERSPEFSNVIIYSVRSN